MRILVLDDNPIETEVMKYRLGKLGLNTITCFNRADDAYRYLRHHDVDLIIFDLDMPDEDGLAVLSELHSMQFENAISILSGLNNDIVTLAEKVAVMLGLNLISSTTKPISNCALTELLQRAKKVRKIDGSKKSDMPSYSLEEIQEGLSQNQFINHYQPQYSFQTGEMVGVEALVRWQHPTHGLRNPNTFVPVIEKAGGTLELFNSVLDQVVNDVSKLPELVTVSINVSVDDFCQFNFVEKLINKLRSHAVSPQRIKLEITEDRVYDLNPVMLKSIARLRIHGFGLSIDDFGVGHSNLINLVSLPFTELKVDKQFVRHYLQSVKHRHALELTVQLAKKLGITIVAEGVEDDDEYLAMNNLGVNVCQGYYTGKAMSIATLLDYMETPPCLVTM